MVTYYAAMATIAQVKEGLTQVGQQLAAGTAMSAEIMGSVLAQLVLFMDIMTKLESGHQVLNTQVVAEFGEMKQQVLVHQGAIEVLTARPEKGHTGGARGILENKSVTSLPMLGTDKTHSAIGTIAW